MPANNFKETAFLASLSRVALASFIWVEYAFDFLPRNHLALSFLPLSFFFFLVSGTLFVGLATRVSCLLMGGGLLFCRVYFAINHNILLFNHHHLSLLAFACLILAFMPSGYYLSMDRFRGRPSAGWDMNYDMIFRALLSSVYLYAALNKINPQWLAENRLYILAIKSFFGSLYIPDWAQSVCLVLTYVTIVVELIFAAGVWFKKATPYLFPVALVLHLGFYLMFPVSIFSVLMLLLWLWVLPRSLVARFMGEPLQT